MSKKRMKVKPGKTQSTFGFVVGILFVLIGCFVVIPTSGLFGILWTGGAAFTTYINFKNAFSEEGFASHEIVIDDEADEIADGDIETKLNKLKSLYEDGLITSEEYQEKRKEILSKF